nr:hypothetical protein [Tanacetum cinerariifolium]
MWRDQSCFHSKKALNHHVIASTQTPPDEDFTTPSITCSSYKLTQEEKTCTMEVTMEMAAYMERMIRENRQGSQDGPHPHVPNTIPQSPTGQVSQHMQQRSQFEVRNYKTVGQDVLEHFRVVEIDKEEDKGGSGVGSLLAKKPRRSWKAGNRGFSEKTIYFSERLSMNSMVMLWDLVLRPTLIMSWTFGLILLWIPSLDYMFLRKVTYHWCFAIDVWDGNWSWRVPLRSRAIDELSSLISLTGNLSLDSYGTDDASGEFEITSLTKSIQNFALGDSGSTWIPRKANICV